MKNIKKTNVQLLVKMIIIMISQVISYNESGVCVCVRVCVCVCVCVACPLAAGRFYNPLVSLKTKIMSFVW